MATQVRFRRGSQAEHATTDGGFKGAAGEMTVELPASVTTPRTSSAIWVHQGDDATGDKAGYFGEAPGVPVIVPAGSVAVFSSLSFHRSGPNTTDQMRRAYVTQYSPEILRRPGETEPMHLGVPFLENGRRILTQ